MKVYSVEFPGVWLGGTAVVVAEDKGAARYLFNREIARHRNTTSERALIPAHIPAEQAPITELDTSKAGVVILDDGNY